MVYIRERLIADYYLLEVFMGKRLIIGPFEWHYAKLVDKQGNFISWASDIEIAQYLGLELDSLNRRGTTVDLQVPYAEKGDAKYLGSKWDAYQKVWYTDLSNPKLGDIMDKHPTWIGVAALDRCDSFSEVAMVYTTAAIEAFCVFQTAQPRQMSGLEHDVCMFERSDAARRCVDVW